MFKIIDDFYNDPMQVREFALGQRFSVPGNYPGLRTGTCNDPVYLEGIQAHFEEIIGKPITYFPTDEYNTAFQLTLRHDTTWVHHDSTDWAAVVYLTPNPLLDSGTAIYRHIHTGIYRHSDDAEFDFNEIQTDESEWEIIAEAKNIFNRCVLYDGMYYHRSVRPGFGRDKEGGRLFQTFFFNT